MQSWPAVEASRSPLITIPWHDPGIIVGLGASWIKALTEPRLQSVAERILPPSPAQKQEVGADPGGRPEKHAPRLPCQPDRCGAWPRRADRPVSGCACRRRSTMALARGSALPIRSPRDGGAWSAEAEARSQGSRSMRAPRVRSAGARNPAATLAAGTGGGVVGVDIARGVRHRAGGAATRRRRLTREGAG